MSYLNDLYEKNKGGGKTVYSLYPQINETVELRLELSNICNHSCLFCPNRKMKRKKVEMPQELVIRLLDEALELGIKKVGFFIIGEPFISKNLEKYIRYAKSAGYLYVYITTNGALATEDRLKECIDAGVDSIKFSINAGSRESYRIVHGRDDYDKVMEHLKFASAYRKKTNCKCRILSSFVVTKYTAGEIEEHYQKMIPMVDELVYFNAENLAGQMPDEIDALRVEIDNQRVPQYKKDMKAPCSSLWQGINVTCEGYLTLCCTEVFNHLVVEDVKEMTLKEAWHSQRMAEMRKKHLENRLQETQCAKCLYNWKGVVKPLNQKLHDESFEQS